MRRYLTRRRRRAARPSPRRSSGRRSGTRWPPARRRPRRRRRGRSRLEPARPPAGDHRHGHLGTHQPDQLEVVAVLGAVGVHRVQQDLARAELRPRAPPTRGVDAGAAAPAVGRHLEAGRRRRAVAEQRRASTDSTSTWRPNRSAISASSSGRAMAAVFTPDLVRTGTQQRVDVVDRAHAAADGERDEHLLRGTPHHVVGRLAAAEERGDVEERRARRRPARRSARASSTGSPASRRPSKLTPLTTRPASTSRHGITRTATLMRQSVLSALTRHALSPRRAHQLASSAQSPAAAEESRVARVQSRRPCRC